MVRFLRHHPHSKEYNPCAKENQKKIGPTKAADIAAVLNVPLDERILRTKGKKLTAVTSLNRGGTMAAFQVET